jgi:hypothetical protein
MSHRLPIPKSLAFQALTAGARFRDRVAVRVHATPEAVFAALRRVTLADMPLAWLLGELRYLPSRLAGAHRAAPRSEPFLSILAAGGTVILVDDMPREIVFGSAGRLHRWLDQAPVRFESREAFEAFDDPGYEKLFISVRVEPTGRPGEWWLVLEHATRALSPTAARRFRPYWWLVGPLGSFAAWRLLRAVRRVATGGDHDRARLRRRDATVGRDRSGKPQSGAGPGRDVGDASGTERHQAQRDRQVERQPAGGERLPRPAQPVRGAEGQDRRREREVEAVEEVLERRVQRRSKGSSGS